MKLPQSLTATRLSALVPLGVTSICACVAIDLGHAGNAAREDLERPMSVESALVFLDGGSVEVKAKVLDGMVVLFLDRPVSGSQRLEVIIRGRRVDVGAQETGAILSALSSWLKIEEEVALKIGNSSTKNLAVRGLFERICFEPAQINLGSVDCAQYLPEKETIK